MNWIVKQTHLSAGGWVSHQKSRFWSIGDARADLAAEIRAIRRTKRYYVVKSGPRRFYFGALDLSHSITACIEAAADLRIDPTYERDIDDQDVADCLADHIDIRRESPGSGWAVRS